MHQTTIDGTYSCNTCGKSSNKRSDLRKHIEAKHLNIVYNCEYCNKNFNALHKYYTHLRRDHGIMSGKSYPSAY